MIGSDTDSTRASTITLILAFLVASILFMTDRGSDRLLQRTQIGAESTMSPGLAILSKPLRGAENLIAEFKDRSRALEENKALKEELYRLREDKQRSQIMAKKLERFEAILAADPGIDIPEKKIAARAVSEVEGPFVRAALINAGRNKGVQKGHPVMTVDGLYGHVLRAGPRASRVLLLGDLNSHVSVMSLRSDARAILSGDNSEQPRLDFVDDRADWKDGDTVVTSGDDGILPRGLPVGTVKETGERKFIVGLNTRDKNVDWVWVYPYVPTQAPDETEAENETAAEDANVVADADNAASAPDSAEAAPVGANTEAGLR
ncbi:rod shape-determining protein MreC [Hellea sp.]|nr:rod shape-determining protein MreC [Hellea sp.]